MSYPITGVGILTTRSIDGSIKVNTRSTTLVTGDSNDNLTTVDTVGSLDSSGCVVVITTIDTEGKLNTTILNDSLATVDRVGFINSAGGIRHRKVLVVNEYMFSQMLTKTFSQMTDKTWSQLKTQ